MRSAPSLKRGCFAAAVLAELRSLQLHDLDLVAERDLAAPDDVGEHASLVVKLSPEAVAQLVHAVARIAHHRDLDQRASDLHPLTDRPRLDVGPLDGDVLSNRPGLDLELVQVRLRHEEHLAPRRVRVSTSLEAPAFEREHGSERPLPRPGETKSPATVAIGAAYP